MAGGAALDQAGGNPTPSSLTRARTPPSTSSRRTATRLALAWARTLASLLHDPVGHHPQLVRQLRRRLVGDLGGEAGQLAARLAYWSMAAASPTSSSSGRRSSNTSWRSRPTLSVAVAASRSSSSVDLGSRRRPPRAWSWRETATMAWMASSWMSPATWRRSCSWLVTTRSSSLRRCSSSWRRLRRSGDVLGDVAQHHQPADRGLPVGHGHHRRLEAAGRPLPGHHQLLGQPVGGRRRVADRLGRLGQQLGQRVADRLGQGEAEEPLGRRVGVDHPAQRVEHQHRLGDGLEDQPAGHRADAEQPEPEQPPDQHQAGHGEQERGQVDPPERPDVEVVEQVEAAGHPG